MRLMNFYFLKARNNYMDLLIVSHHGERRGYNSNGTAGIFFGLLYESSVSGLISQHTAPYLKA